MRLPLLRRLLVVALVVSLLQIALGAYAVLVPPDAASSSAATREVVEDVVRTANVTYGAILLGGGVILGALTGAALVMSRES